MRSELDRRGRAAGLGVAQVAAVRAGAAPATTDERAAHRGDGRASRYVGVRVERALQRAGLEVEVAVGVGVGGLDIGARLDADHRAGVRVGGAGLVDGAGELVAGRPRTE